MKNRASAIVRVAAGIGVLAPAVAAAQETANASHGLEPMYLLGGIVSTLLYGTIGIVLTMVGYKVFAWVLPFDVKKELEEDHNVSVGILLAALVLGICIVVAATIHS